MPHMIQRVMGRWVLLRYGNGLSSLDTHEGELQSGNELTLKRAMHASDNMHMANGCEIDLYGSVENVF